MDTPFYPCPVRTLRQGSEFMLLHPNGMIEQGPPYNVRPSPSWRCMGAVRYNNFGRVVQHYSLAEVLTDHSIQWRHANGKQRVHINDFDHGTRRTWMSPVHSL